MAGAFVVLMHEKGTRFEDGVSILVASDVPEGKGVSSSAAVEVSVMSAVAAAFRVRLESRELALLCQKVEPTAAYHETRIWLKLLCFPKLGLKG